DHLILIEPRPIEFMGNFAPYLSKFDQVFAHTPLGHVFVRNSHSGAIAVVVPFESNVYDLGTFDSAEAFRRSAIVSDPLLPESVIRREHVEKLRKRLGDLKKEQV